jgi:sulfur-oxidizing protein SoxY
MIDTKRRILLKGSLAAGAIGFAVGAGLLTPRAVLGAWPEKAFNADSVDGALTELLGTKTHKGSESVKLPKPPDIAEMPSQVPVTVEFGGEGANSISIMAPGNQKPLIASFILGEGAVGFVSTRVKLAQTQDVMAVVKVGGELFSATKRVQVTEGGCGA